MLSGGVYGGEGVCYGRRPDISSGSNFRPTARNKVLTYSGLGASEETPHAEKVHAKWAMLRSK